MITTDRDDVAERAERFVNHGRTDTYEHAEVGHNFRMTSIAAAIGRAQLTKLPDNVAARRANAAALSDAVREVDGATPPVEPAGRKHAFHQYTVRTSDREALRSHLADRGIDTSVYYPRPIHDQPAYADVDADAPDAERAAETVLSLPVHQGLDADDLRRVTDSLHTYDNV
jgi:dTDP-4-amino-4,6-dideoxygalactose transaminase